MTRAHCQNGCQGLGFKVPGLGVIDKKSMAAYAAKLYTALGTVVSLQLAGRHGCNRNHPHRYPNAPPA